jgi:hypothetical protein
MGLDVHLRTCHATVMDEHGRILKQEKFPNERLEFGRIHIDVEKFFLGRRTSG